MSALDPSGTSQPTTQQAYETADNPVTKEPAERSAAKDNAHLTSQSESVERRTATSDSSDSKDATPTSLARGIRGAGPGEEAHGATEEDVGRHQELEAEQMAPPAEGKVYEAVAGRTRPGGTGEQPDTASDLDRKKAEQESARGAIKEQRKDNVDVGGILGQRGGPADPKD